jgi:mRNA-degrading endonuclease YafQ of YafQ-DinJ toxin-antitoxin module
MSKAKSAYLIQILPDVREDINLLPPQLQQNWHQYQKILAIDPHNTLGFPSHNLIGKLRGFRALEIDCDGLAYRLIYRIFEKPAPKRVLILSFAEHDPAYERAKQRR